MVKINIIMIHAGDDKKQPDHSFVPRGKESLEMPKIHIHRVFSVKHHFNRRGKFVSSNSNDLTNPHF